MEELIKGWVARDKNGNLWLYKKGKPIKFEREWRPQNRDSKYMETLNDEEIFSEIKWEDEEPTKVEISIKICR